MRFVRAVALCLAIFGTACSPSENQGVVLNRGNGAEIKSLDPAFIQGNYEQWLLGDVIMGLTTEGPRGEPIPGAATGWDVSPDGLTWTFHLRKAVWSDGVPVTSADFAFAWRRELDPKTAAVYAYNLWVVKFAHAVSTGKLVPSKLGIETPDALTFVVHLEHPAPYFSELVDHEVAWPVPRHVVRTYGAAWSHVGHIVGNGPYTVKAWVPNDHVTLVKNPLFYDAAHVRIDTVNYFDTGDSEAALKRFRAGELDTQNPFPNDQIDWMRRNIPDAIRIAPYLGVDYMAMNFERAPFRDIRLREALNLAYDREALVANVRRIGETPAYGIVPPGVANYPRHAEMNFKAMPFAARLAKARVLMHAMGYGSEHPLALDYVTSTNPDQRRRAAAVQGMLAKIYIKMTITTLEGGVFLNTMQQHQFDLASPLWIADFNDASNFLDLLRHDSGENYGAYDNPAFDSLLDKAQRQTDPQIRGALLRQAEQLALDDYAWVPTYYLVTRDLVQPYVKGWIANVKDFNRTRWLWIDRGTKH
ncbi:MAG: peptide ABC transporter substrate-binding protein [Rhizomicrobium sp.]